MKLNSNYRYIWLDFETTWLDFTKDEPIQIGIVEMDHTGKIINEFSSFLKPTKDINELRTIVWFITKIDIEDICNAPTPQDIIPNIKNFFGEKTILIWHNIRFDLEFLHKFFPDLKYADTIDTFPLAQAVIHYQPSYALEVLVPGENAHNALQDTRNALILFQKNIERLELLQSKYPILSNFTSNSNFSISKYLHDKSIIKDQTINDPKIKDIPRLSKIMWANSKLQANESTLITSKLENQKRYYLGNSNLKSFLEKIVSNKNIILAFSNLQKLNIAKSMLNNMGIKNLGFLKDDQVIDYEKFENFLNKQSFTNEEIIFVCKYYSHIEQGLWLLDLNTKSDYQIYHAIKNKKEKTRYPIILATHQGLFSYVKEEINEYQDYEIMFFDAERWYKSYNLFLSRPWDMYYTLNFIETLLYKQSLDSKTGNNEKEQKLPHFYNFFQIFIGQLFMDSKQFFIGKNTERVQSNPITTEPTFYKTNLLWKQIKDEFLLLENELQKNDFTIIKKQFDHIENLLNTVVNIEKKTTTEDMYFVYSEHTQYTSWSEFTEIFPSNIYFFSNSDKSAINLFPDQQTQQLIKTIKIWLYDRVISYIQQNNSTNEVSITNNDQAEEKSKQSWKSFFIVSTRKEESKELFEILYKNNLHNEYVVVAENITWWAGKNIFKLKNNKPKIIIGGYAFLLSIYADRIPLDEIVVFNIRGNNEQSILDDIQWYANK